MREVKKVDIKASSIYASVRFLSGGNQQKVVFAKWMLKKLNTLLVDEPTHGVDVKTKAEIYKTLIMEKKEGRSIIVYSRRHGNCSMSVIASSSPLPTA